MTPDEPQTRMTDAELVEQVARALCKLERLDPDEDPNYVNGSVMTEVAFPPEARLWWRFRRQAQAAIDAIARTPSVEPPREMVERARAIYEDFKPVVLPRSNGNVWEEDYHAAIIKRWAAEFTSVRSQAVEECRKARRD